MRRDDQLQRAASDHRSGFDTFLLRLNDRLRNLDSPEAIQFEAASMLGRALGASRVGYAEDAGDGEHVLVTRNYTDGVAGIEGRYRYDDYGPALLRALLAGQTVVRADIAADPTLSAQEKAAHVQLALGATVNVPLLRAGRLVAVMFMHFRDAHAWSDDEVRMLDAVAARTWDAVIRARIEATLRDREARYRSLFESIDAGFCIIEVLFDDHGRPQDYRFVEVNPAFERHTGLKNAVGRRALEMLPDLGREWIEIYGRVALSGQAERFQRREAAMERVFDVYAFRIGDPQSRHVALLFNDITARSRAEDALRASESRYRALVTQLPGGAVFVVDRDLRYLEAAGEALSGAGFKAEQFIGRTVREAVGPELAALYEPHFRLALAGTPFEWEHDAHGRSYRSRGVPLRDRKGEVEAVLVASYDITDRRQMERALQQADRRKDEFLATLAHELRNPLAPLKNGLEIARMVGGGNAQLERTLAMMQRQLTHLTHLVDDLLDVGRISAGKLSLQLRPLTMPEVLAASVESVRVHLDAQQHHLAVDIAPAAPAMLGDRERLAQVFTNLLTNAAKYTDRGGRIRLRLRHEPGVEVVDIEDSGIGIPPDDLPRVFDQFSQVRQRQGRGAGGLGIGLSIVRKLVAMHGGEVHAYSEGMGKGSRFTVRLPVIAPPATQAQASASSASAAARRRVLVVDDNIDAAASMAELLRLLGHEAWLAHNGLQAIEQAQALSPDLILLDIGMPVMDGIEAARRLRALPHGAQWRLAALTGWGQAADRRQTEEAGFDWHLVKPVDLADLAALLARL